MMSSVAQAFRSRVLPVVMGLWCLAIVAIVLLSHGLEPHLLLSAISALLFAAAGMTVVLAMSMHAKADTVTINLWDVAGGLVISGCVASILAEPEHAAQVFEHFFERGAKSK